ncbi:MAG: hypothetical protein WC213_00015 [Arenimonas sp.]|jgi:hypothetical protein
MPDIALPEVPAMHQHARFFKDNGLDFIEISFTGVKDTVIKKVGPDHMSKFRDAWNAYCDGTPMARRAGTSLTLLNGVDQQLADKYIAQNVHTVEELAALNDAQCQALGHGTLTLRKQANDRLSLLKFQTEEKARKAVSDAAATIGAMPAEKYASASEVAELKQGIDDLKALLAQALATKKPGRPKKDN